MPVQGNLAFGAFPDMEEAELRALEVGIPLFQLVHPTPLYFDQPLHGPFDVKVQAIDPDSRRRAPEVTWFHAGEAHITFHPKNRNGLAIAWVPDDPWMHNRIIFLDHPAMLRMVKQERMPDGVIKSAAEVMFEVKVMEEVLKTPIEIWNVFRDGRGECPFESKKAAHEYIDSIGKMEVKMDPQRGLVPVKVNKCKMTIEPGQKLVWKPEVKALIVREIKKNRFGWTDCDEFKTKWKPMILNAINEKRSSFQQANDEIAGADAVEQIDNLPVDQLDALLRRLDARRKELTKGKRGSAVQPEGEVVT